MAALARWCFSRETRRGIEVPAIRMRTAFQNALDEIIVEARERGIKIKDLCEEAGVSRATLHRYRTAAPDSVMAVDKLRVALRRAKRDQRRAEREAESC